LERLFKEEYLIMSNQVRTTIETKISDCRLTIAKVGLYCRTDLIWLYQIFLLKTTILRFLFFSFRKPKHKGKRPSNVFLSFWLFLFKFNFCRDQVKNWLKYDFARIIKYSKFKLLDLVLYFKLLLWYKDRFHFKIWKYYFVKDWLRECFQLMLYFDFCYQHITHNLILEIIFKWNIFYCYFQNHLFAQILTYHSLLFYKIVIACIALIENIVWLCFKNIQRIKSKFVFSYCSWWVH